MTHKSIVKKAIASGLLITIAGSAVPSFANDTAVTGGDTLAVSAVAETSFNFINPTVTIDSKESFRAGDIPNVGTSNINFTIPDGTAVGAMSEPVTQHPDLIWQGFSGGKTLPAMSGGEQIGEWVATPDYKAVQLRVTADLTGKTNINGTTKLTFGKGKTKVANDTVITPEVTVGGKTTVADYTYTFFVSTVVVQSESYSGQIASTNKINNVFYSTPNYRGDTNQGEKVFTFNLGSDETTFDEHELKGLRIAIGPSKAGGDSVSYSFWELTNGVDNTKTTANGTVVPEPTFSYELSADGKEITLKFDGIQSGMGWTGRIPVLLSDEAYNKGLADGQNQDYPITATSNTDGSVFKDTFANVTPEGIYPGTNLPYQNLRWTFNTASANADTVPAVTLQAIGNDLDGDGTTDDTKVESDGDTLETAVNTLNSSATTVFQVGNPGKVAGSVTIKNSAGEVVATVDNLAPGETKLVTLPTTLSTGENSEHYTAEITSALNSALKATASDSLVFVLHEVPKVAIDIEHTIDGKDADTAVTLAPGSYKTETKVTNNSTISMTGDKLNVTVNGQKIILPADFTLAPGETKVVETGTLELGATETIQVEASATYTTTHTLPAELGGNKTLTANDTDPSVVKALQGVIDLVDDHGSTTFTKSVSIDLTKNDTSSTPFKILPESIFALPNGDLVVSEDGKTITAPNGKWTIDNKGIATWNYAEGATIVEIPSFEYQATNALMDATNPATVTVDVYKPEITVKAEIQGPDGEWYDAQTLEEMPAYKDASVDAPVRVTISNPTDKDLSGVKLVMPNGETVELGADVVLDAQGNIVWEGTTTIERGTPVLDAEYTAYAYYDGVEATASDIINGQTLITDFEVESFYQDDQGDWQDADHKDTAVKYDTVGEKAVKVVINNTGDRDIVNPVVTLPNGETITLEGVAIPVGGTYEYVTTYELGEGETLSDWGVQADEVFKTDPVVAIVTLPVPETPAPETPAPAPETPAPAPETPANPETPATNTPVAKQYANTGSSAVEAGLLGSVLAGLGIGAITVGSRRYKFTK